MLEQLFLQVLDMSLEASVIILIIVCIRACLKKVPKFLSYMIWLCVIVRLLCPIVLEFKINLIPSGVPTFSEVIYENYNGNNIVNFNKENVVDNMQKGDTQVIPDDETNRETMSLLELGIKVAVYIWLLGGACLLLFSYVSFLKVRKRVKTALLVSENIYLTDREMIPFVMGIFRPRIFVPDGLHKQEQEFIILHEKFHIKRLDHIIKMVAYLAVCVHWFNPLVWLAFHLFSKDMEMSCDEAIIKQIGEKEKANYATAIVALSTKYSVIQGSPIAFAQGDTMGRVENLMNMKTMKKGVLLLLVFGVLVVMVCLLSDWKWGGSHLTKANDTMKPGIQFTYDLDGDGEVEKIEVWDQVEFNQSILSIVPFSNSNMTRISFEGAYNSNIWVEDINNDSMEELIMQLYGVENPDTMILKVFQYKNESLIEIVQYDDTMIKNKSVEELLNLRLSENDTVGFGSEVCVDLMGDGRKYLVQTRYQVLVNGDSRSSISKVRAFLGDDSTVDLDIMDEFKPGSIMAVNIDGDQKEEIALLEYNIGSNYGIKTLKILSYENNRWVEVKIPEKMQQDTGIIDVTIKHEEEGDVLEFLVYNGEIESVFKYSYRNDEWVLK